MYRRRLIASLLVGVAVAWGLWLAPLQWPRATLPAPAESDPAAWIYFSPDSKQLVTVHLHDWGGAKNVPLGNLGSATLWNASDGTAIAKLTNKKRLVNSIAFSPDGATLAVRQEDGNIFRCDRATGKIDQEIADHPKKDVSLSTQIAYAPDGRLLFEDGQNWTLMRYVDTGKVAFDFRHEISGLGGGTINHRGYYLAAGGQQAVVVRLDTGERIARFVSTEGHMDTNGALSPDGRSYASTFWTNANQIVVWSQETQIGSSEPRIVMPPNPYLSNQWNVQNRFAVANDAALLTVSASYYPRKWIIFGEESKVPRYRIHVYDPRTAEEVGRIEDGHLAAFSPDGRTLAVTLGNGDVQLWDLPLRKPWAWIVLTAMGMALITYLLLVWRAQRTNGSLAGPIESSPSVQGGFSISQEAVTLR